MSIVIDRKEVAQVPVLEVFSQDSVGKKPLVILIHGWGGRKEDMLTIAYHLARGELFVVSIDAVGHGERALNEPWTWSSILTILGGTATDVMRVAEAYSGHPLADASRLGVSGLSMGGIITFQVLTSGNGKPKAAVPMIATPDLLSLRHARNSEHIYEMLGITPDVLLQNGTLQVLQQMQPLSRADQMIGIPVLMLNGVDDPLIPIEDVRAFYEKTRPLYPNIEAFQLIEYPGVGHFVTAEMEEEALRWFRRYL